MATITYIPEKTQSKTAMGKVMRYCTRNDKTLCKQDGRQFQLISGKDCCGETAYKEFMATKQQYGKSKGMFFYQYVQSFSPNENITPQQAHEIGCKFAEYFKGHEVLISTHTDVAHIHTHLIINSVNHENGKKLQMKRGSIHDLRRFSDEICRQYDLSIVKPKEKKAKGINTREYRAALKGESWKFKLINTVDNAMAASRTKAEFIANMQKMGYGVKWSDNRKHITYTTPDGHKCRDNKMHDDKYLKHNMEVYYEYRAVKGFEQAGQSDRGLSNKNSNVRYSTGHVGTAINTPIGDRTGANTNAGANRTITEMAGDTRKVVSDSRTNRKPPHTGGGKLRKESEIGISEQSGNYEISSQQSGIGTNAEYGRTVNGKRFIANKTKIAMDGLGRDDTTDIIRIAKNIEDVVNPHNSEKKCQEQIQKESQKRQMSHDWDMEM